MNLAASDRRAALMVHALGGADREWLLQQLPRDQRDRLQALLADLQALGIPADAALLQQAIAAPAPEPARATAPQPPALEDADPAALARALQNEPARLVAQLLHARAWPWRAALLEQLPALKRRRVEEALAALQGTPATPVALQEALVAAVLRRVPAAMPAARLPAARWHGVLRWLRRAKGRA